jgi:manganese/zinc/iron transport system ATP- binding protein
MSETTKLPPGRPVIELHNLTVTYNRKPALYDVDFVIPENKLVGIVGPNGSGKTTMLKAIMGLIESDSGHVEIFGQPLESVRHRIAYVPQRGSVDWDFPVSVLDVVLMGRLNPKKIFRRTTAADRNIAMEALHQVQMEGFVTRQISQLSGGQQQRVFLARALAQEAELYVLDEPFAGVDAATEKAIIHLLQEMKTRGRTIVVVHHDLQTVQHYFDWLIMLNTRLVASGPMDQVFTPEILNQTYGGKLNILTQVGDLMQQQNYPVREEKPRK